MFVHLIESVTSVLSVLRCLIRVASVLSVLRCFISVASVLSVLRVFYQCCECFISVASVLSKKRLFEFSSTSIYQTSIICTPFSMNQHTNMLAAGIRLLAYKHRVYRVL